MACSWLIVNAVCTKKPFVELEELHISLQTLPAQCCGMPEQKASPLAEGPSPGPPRVQGERIQLRDRDRAHQGDTGDPRTAGLYQATACAWALCGDPEYTK